MENNNQNLQSENQKNPQSFDDVHDKSAINKRNWYKYGFWGIVILVIMYLPIYFYFSTPRTFWNDYSTGENVTIGPLPSPTTLPNYSPAPQTNSNWKIYSNDEFTFSYPSEMILITDDMQRKSPGYISGVSVYREITHEVESLEKDSYGFSVIKYSDYQTALSRLKEEHSFLLTECSSPYKQDENVSEITYTAIGNFQGVTYDYNCRGNGKNILVQKDRFAFEINLNYGDIYDETRKNLVIDIFKTSLFK